MHERWRCSGRRVACEWSAVVTAAGQLLTVAPFLVSWVESLAVASHPLQLIRFFRTAAFFGLGKAEFFQTGLDKVRGPRSNLLIT
jgi:hypothetical protein